MDQFVVVGSEVLSVRNPSFALGNVHDEHNCVGRRCVIHNPSDHHMRDWHLHWRQDRGLFERICPCGIGHPDPDQFDYWRLTGQRGQSVHGCCGHCRPL